MCSEQAQKEDIAGNTAEAKKYSAKAKKLNVVAFFSILILELVLVVLIAAIGVVIQMSALSF